MKKQYTKRQILESIKYWEKQLKMMNEDVENNLTLPHIESNTGFSFDDIFDFLDDNEKLLGGSKARYTKVIYKDDYGTYYGIGFRSIRVNDDRKQIIINNLQSRNAETNLTIADFATAIASFIEFNKSVESYTPVIGGSGLDGDPIKNIKIIKYRTEYRNEPELVLVMSAKAN